jgi:hypothetical protein
VIGASSTKTDFIAKALCGAILPVLPNARSSFSPVAYSFS